MQFGSHAHLATKIVVHRTKRKTGIIQKNSFKGPEEANARKKKKYFPIVPKVDRKPDISVWSQLDL